MEGAWFASASVSHRQRVPSWSTGPAGRSFLDSSTRTRTRFTRAALEQAVVFGVTAHLDQFTTVPVMKQLKAEQDSGRAAGRADLFTAGVLITAPRGHGTQFGIPIPTLTAPADAQAFIDARIAEGSDWIKLVYDGGKTYGRVSPTLSYETLAAGIAAAHARGKVAVVHIGDEVSAIEALRAGADGLVHIFTDSAEGDVFVKLAAARKAFVIPTLAVSYSLTGRAYGAELLKDAAFETLLDDGTHASLKQSFGGFPRARYGHAEGAVRQLHRLKVPLLAGTDAPNPGTTWGASIHQELELLVAAGLSPLQALASATSIPAAKFRLAGRGRIAPGMRADLVLVEGDPTTDITRTRAIVGVWKGGVGIDREAVRRRVATARASAADARARRARRSAGRA